METREQVDQTSERERLLLRMYDQMFSDIDRQIKSVWFALAAMLVSLVLSAVGTPIDLWVAVTVLLVGWVIAQLYDAAYWYNRNLAIISNIEREFLRREFLQEKCTRWKPKSANC